MHSHHDSLELTFWLQERELAQLGMSRRLAKLGLLRVLHPYRHAMEVTLVGSWDGQKWCGIIRGDRT